MYVAVSKTSKIKTITNRSWKKKKKNVYPFTEAHYEASFHFQSQPPGGDGAA